MALSEASLTSAPDCGDAPVALCCRFRPLHADAPSCRCPLFEPPSDGPLTSDRLCALCDHPQEWHHAPTVMASAEAVRRRMHGQPCFERCKATRPSDGDDCPCPIYKTSPTTSNCDLCGCKKGWHRPTELSHNETLPHSLIKGQDSAASRGPTRNSSTSSTSGLKLQPSFKSDASPFGPGEHSGRHGINQSMPALVTRRASSREHSAYKAPMSVHTCSSSPQSLQSQNLPNLTPAFREIPLPKDTWESMTPQTKSEGRKPSFSKKFSAVELRPKSSGGSSHFSSDRNSENGRMSSIRRHQRVKDWVHSSTNKMINPPLTPIELPLSVSASQSTLKTPIVMSSFGAEVFHSAKMRFRASITPQPSRHTFIPGDTIAADLELGHTVKLSNYESVTVAITGLLKVQDSRNEPHEFFKLEKVLYAGSKTADGRRRQWAIQFKLPNVCTCGCDQVSHPLPSSMKSDNAFVQYQLVVIGKRKERLKANDKISANLVVDTGVAASCTSPTLDHKPNYAWTSLDQMIGDTRLSGVGGNGITSAALEVRMGPKQPGMISVPLHYRASYQFASGVVPSDHLVAQLVGSHSLTVSAGGKRRMASGGRGATRTVPSMQLHYEHLSPDVPAYMVFQHSNVAAKIEGIVMISRSDLEQARASSSTIFLSSRLAFEGLSSPIRMLGPIGHLLPVCPAHWLPLPPQAFHAISPQASFCLTSTQSPTFNPAHSNLVSSQSPANHLQSTFSPSTTTSQHGSFSSTQFVQQSTSAIRFPFTASTTLPFYGDSGHLMKTYRHDLQNDEAGSDSFIAPRFDDGSDQPTTSSILSDLESIIDEQMNEVENMSNVVKGAWSHRPSPILRL